jgi:NADH:quinone reductase (non-electrogenic)
VIKTALTELLGIPTPIIGGTMMDLSTAPFVTAICEAGALGILASAIYKDYDHFRDDIKQVKDGTDGPFGVNINLFPAMQKLDNVQYLEIMAEEGVAVVETSGFAPPEELLGIFRDAGMKWLHKCVGVRYARKAASLGADGVTVVGYENGGATGTLNLGTLVLVNATVQALDIPVIGGGGVVDGRSLLAVLALGAAGAIVGTRLLLAEECPVHADLKAALCEAKETDTDVIMRSVGFAHRIWMNEPAKKVRELEAQGAGLADIYPYVSGRAAKKMFDTGDIQAGTVSVSQGVGLIREVKPLKDIIDEMVAEAEQAHAGLLG